MSQLENNLGAADLQLSDEELAVLDELTAPPLSYPNWFAARVVDPPVRDALSGAGTRKAAQ
jgi:diketogulonate reductase-like aldo/keto reductase